MHRDAGPHTLEINKNTKIAKGPRTTGRTDGRTYYTTTQGILPYDLRLYVLHAITGRGNDRQKATRTTRQREGRTDGDISSTGTHWDPSDPSVGI